MFKIAYDAGVDDDIPDPLLQQLEDGMPVDRDEETGDGKSTLEHHNILEGKDQLNKEDNNTEDIINNVNHQDVTPSTQNKVDNSCYDDKHKGNI